MPYLAKLRLRVFAVLVGLTLGVIGVVGMLSVPVLPALGVALVAAAAVVNSMTAKLGAVTCAGCGTSIAAMPAGTYGITCTGCGTINLPYRSGESATMIAIDSDDDSIDEDATNA